MIAANGYLVAVAVCAPDTVRPACLDEPRFGGRVVGETVEQINQAHAFPIGFPRCFLCHFRPRQTYLIYELIVTVIG